MFDTGTLEEFKGAVNRLLLPKVVFSSVFRGAGACGVAKAIYKKNFVFPSSACAPGFNNNNNNNIKVKLIENVISSCHFSL